MGISYPYLAILSTIAFIVVVTSVTFLYLYIIDQANKTPVLGVYAEAYLDSQDHINLVITIRHERGRAVELKKVVLNSENGTLTLTDFRGNENISLIGCADGLIPTGGVCRLRLIFHEGFMENTTYKGVVFLTEGTYPIAFTPVRWNLS
ncbi:MAG: hypothetical protein QXK88_02945 [Desulfurococcaceae archaeon]